jgi:hypothetical protein
MSEIIVVSSPFQFFAAAQFVRAFSCRDPQLFAIESPAANVDWSALIEWAGMPVTRIPRSPPPSNAQGRGLALWSHLDAFAVAAKVVQSARGPCHRLCLGSYADRVQRAVRWLLNVPSSNIVILDDGLDSVGLEERIRNDALRSPLALPIGVPVSIYSAILRGLDSSLGHLTTHRFEKLSLPVPADGHNWFIGQPLISDGLLGARAFASVLSRARNNGASGYLAHPRDRDAELLAAKATGLHVVVDHRPAELVIGGSERIFGVHSTVLFSAKSLGLAREVRAYRPRARHWRSKARLDLLNSVYCLLGEAGVVVDDID